MPGKCGAGVVTRLSPAPGPSRDVLNQFRTAGADGPHKLAEWGGPARYGAMFAGTLWDVAARQCSRTPPF